MSENGQTPPPTPESPAKAKTRHLTPKQRNFIKIRTANPGISDSEAMRRAGYAATTAGHAKDKIVKSTNVQERVRAALEAQGLTDEYLALRVKEGTQAYKATYLKDGAISQVKHPDGTLETKGLIEKKDIDFYARHKAVELSYKLRGEIIDRAQTENTFPEGIPLITNPDELKSLERQYGHVFADKKKRGKK